MFTAIPIMRTYKIILCTLIYVTTQIFGVGNEIRRSLELLKKNFLNTGKELLLS